MTFFIALYFIINAIITFSFLNSPGLMLEGFEIDMTITDSDRDEFQSLIMFILCMFVFALLISVVGVISYIISKIITAIFFKSNA